MLVIQNINNREKKKNKKFMFHELSIPVVFAKFKDIKKQK